MQRLDRSSRRDRAIRRHTDMSLAAVTNEPSADNWSENDQLLPSDPAQPNGSFQGCNGHLCRRDDRVHWADTKHDFCLKASSNGTVEFDCIPHRAECIDDWARTGSVFRRTRPICAEETRRDGRHFDAEPGDSLRQYFGNSFKCEFAAAVVSDTRHRNEAGRRRRVCQARPV